MNTETRMTEEERLLQLEAEADKLRQDIAQRKTQQRPNAIAQVLALIAEFDLSRKDVESPTWRKRAFKARKPRADAGIPRGPRKPKLVETAKAA